MEIEFDGLDSLMHALFPHPPIMFFRPMALSGLARGARQATALSSRSQAADPPNEITQYVVMSASFPPPVAPGNYDVLLFASGESKIAPVLSSVSIGTSGNSTLHFHEQIGFSVSGTLVTPDGKGLVNVPYAVLTSDSDSTVFDGFEFPLTDSAGTFSIAMPSGGYRLRFYVSSSQGLFVDVPITLNADVNLGQILVN